MFFGVAFWKMMIERTVKGIQWVVENLPLGHGRWLNSDRR
jgi:hypothetical protein